MASHSDFLLSNGDELLGLFSFPSLSHMSHMFCMFANCLCCINVHKITRTTVKWLQKARPKKASAFFF